MMQVSIPDCILDNRTCSAEQAALLDLVTNTSATLKLTIFIQELKLDLTSFDAPFHWDRKEIDSIPLDYVISFAKSLIT